MSLDLNIQAAEILESAAFVISTGAWYQGGLATDSTGVILLCPLGYNACAWCSLGAIDAARQDLCYTYAPYDIAENTLRKIVLDCYPWFESVAAWNDAKSQTAEKVANLMWLAAERLRAGAVAFRGWNRES